MTGWANHMPGAPWGDSRVALARSVHGAATGVPRRRRQACVCMGGTAECVPPFGPSGGCSLSDDQTSRTQQSSYASGREHWPQEDPPTRDDLLGDG